MTSVHHRIGFCGFYRPLISFLAILSVIGSPTNWFEPSCVQAASVVVTGTTPHPLLGNYRGTLTGAISGIGIPSQGIVVSVDRTGKMTILCSRTGDGHCDSERPMSCHRKIRFEPK
jgi:hypothetical protein